MLPCEDLQFFGFELDAPFAMVRSSLRGLHVKRGSGVTAMDVATKRLGPYEILQKLNAGGMGDVYRARDTRLDREIAIKVRRRDSPTTRSRWLAFSAKPGRSQLSRIRTFERSTMSVARAARRHPMFVNAPQRRVARRDG